MPQPQEKLDHGATTGAPRWVRAFGIIAVALVVLVIVLHLTGHAPVGHGR